MLLIGFSLPFPLKNNGKRRPCLWFSIHYDVIQEREGENLFGETADDFGDFGCCSTLFGKGLGKRGLAVDDFLSVVLCVLLHGRDVESAVGFVCVFTDG